MNSKIVIALLLVIVGGAGFFAGTKYQESKTTQAFRQRSLNGRGNGQSQMGARLGTRPVSGEIIGKDDKSITVKLQDGSSKIVLVTDTTSINKAAKATKDDLTIGEKVAAFGQDNSDGSVTAQNIQLNPVAGGQ